MQFTHLKPKTQEQLFDLLENPDFTDVKFMDNLVTLTQCDGSVAIAAAELYLSQYGLPTTEEELVKMVNDPSVNKRKMVAFLGLRQGIYDSLLDRTNRTISDALINRLFPEIKSKSKEQPEMDEQRDLEISNHYVHIPETKD